MMKKYILAALLCTLAMYTYGQRISRNYQDESLSKVLQDLNTATTDKTIYFIYDELEDFTVTCRFTNLPIKEAIREVIGFYPMRVTFDENNIFVECTQKEDTKVTGRIVDQSGQPIEFANISLHNDGLLVNGGVSNENGDFVIPCNRKKITMKVSYIGYKTETRQVSVGNIGTITLQPETYMVKGVEIKGEIPQFKPISGGMTVDVQHSLLHDIGNADELLSMIPLVRANDGKFEVLSKGEPEIYINNKKVRNLSELKHLKSTDVKSVDVITAPGAQYNAEVNAVINIRTHRILGEGFSLIATSETTKNNKWSNYDDLTLKYRIGGLEAFANVALDNGHYSVNQDIVQFINISKDHFLIFMDAPIRTSWTQLQYQAGLSYDFNDSHAIGLSFSSQKNISSIFRSNIEQRYQKNGAQLGNILLNMDVAGINKPIWEVNTYYIGKVGKLGIDLNATLLTHQEEDHYNEFEQSQELGNRTITICNWKKDQMAAAKLVLNYPIWKGRLTGGSEITSSDSHGHNENQEYIMPEADNLTSEFNVAGFAEYELLLGQWHLNVGLRYEHVSTDVAQFGTSKPELSRNYNDWFPNASVAWQKGKWGAQLGYSKRITRPRYEWLSSVVQYDSRMFYQGGNPLLRPSVRQSIDFNLTYSWLNFTAGFTHENDFFTHTGKVYDAQKEIVIFMPENFDHQDRVYATLVASPKFGFWQPTATLHYYQQMFDVEKYGVAEKLNKPEFSIDLKSWFVINTTTKALLQASFTGSNHWGFMYRGSDFCVNARIQKTLLKGQLTAALFANDIFNTRCNDVTTYYAIGHTAQSDYGYKQAVGLSLSYNFNATRSKYKGTGAGNEEKSRF